MAKGDIHTEPQGDGWANKAEGNKRASSTHQTKSAAQKRGRVERLITERIDQLAAPRFTATRFA